MNSEQETSVNSSLFSTANSFPGVFLLTSYIAQKTLADKVCSLLCKNFLTAKPEKEQASPIPTQPLRNCIACSYVDYVQDDSEIRDETRSSTDSKRNSTFSWSNMGEFCFQGTVGNSNLETFHCGPLFIRKLQRFTGEAASSLASSLPCMLAFHMERAKYSVCMFIYCLYMSCTATIPIDHKLLTLTFSVTEAQPTNCRPFFNLSVTSRRERSTSALPVVKRRRGNK